jgi:hypothetical protein
LAEFSLNNVPISVYAFWRPVVPKENGIALPQEALAFEEDDYDEEEEGRIR